MQSDVVPRGGGGMAAARARASIVLRSVRIYEALAESALQHVALGEEEEAAQTIADALHLLDGVRDRAPFARVLLNIGQCLIDIGHADQAAQCLREAVQLADILPDGRIGARARCALGKAMLLLGDPSCLAILDDAGVMFKERGDWNGISAVKKLLQTAKSIMPGIADRLTDQASGG